MQWRVAEVLQFIPATPSDEAQLHVHFYDTPDHCRDITERKFHAAYRDTKDDREVYDSAFRGAIAKPAHYIEFIDTLPAQTLLEMLS